MSEEPNYAELRGLCNQLKETADFAPPGIDNFITYQAARIREGIDGLSGDCTWNYEKPPLEYVFDSVEKLIEVVEGKTSLSGEQKKSVLDTATEIKSKLGKK